MNYDRRILVTGQSVEIRDGTTCLMKANADDVAREFYGPTYGRYDFGLLPPGVRWISSDRRTFAIERPADFNLVSLGYPGRFTKLPMPYRLVFVTFADEFSKVEKIMAGFSRKSIQTLATELIPFPGCDRNLSVPVPTTLSCSDASRVGPYLSDLWQHLDASLYRVWQTRGLKPETMPTNYTPEGTAYASAHFVEWWAEQTVEDVCAWEYADPTAIDLKALLNEFDTPVSWTSTWEYFQDLVGRGVKREEARLELERKRREELRKKGGDDKNHRRISLQSILDATVSTGGSTTVTGTGIPPGTIMQGDTIILPPGEFTLHLGDPAETQTYDDAAQTETAE